MPNHVQNIVRLQGDEKRIKEMMDTFQKDEYGVGSLDFEKIIPMPPPLLIECGFNTDRGLKAYLDFLESGLESESKFLHENTQIDPKEFELGKLACDNIEKYGAATWYDWRIENWGTKWNAYDQQFGRKKNKFSGEPNLLHFQTAWSAPYPILEKLAQIYPDVIFEHEWADEDFGVNCGRRIYQGRIYQDGKLQEEYYPEGAFEATKFALSVWKYEPEQMGMSLSASGTAYIYVEMKGYELIELFGAPALFSNERMSDDDVPAGLYCYNLRHSDDGKSFATIEPRVKVNCAGSVITDTPIDFGEKGYISFTDGTSPNFLGKKLTFAEFMSGDFEFEEEQNTSMEDMQL